MSVKCFYIQSIILLYPKINNFKEMSCWNLFFKIYISSLSYTHTHTHTHTHTQEYEEQVIADLIAYSCMLPSKPGRVTDPWSTPGNAALGVEGFL